ncbi:FAD synthase [Candidatus Peregrinibacteria bacterium]|nr:MAG: FAD synthase [Candidatus Peregrinibacteria bacterium]
MPPSSDKKIVMAFGTFDYFHAGHEDYLRQAKILGDQLIVVVGRDETVKKVKGFTPGMNEKKRLRDVAACTHVDKAVLGYPEDKYYVIKKHRPHILALGYDQFAFTYGLKNFFIKENLDIEIVRLDAFEPQTFKSSLIRNKLEGEEKLTLRIPLPDSSKATPCAPEALTLFAD